MRITAPVTDYIKASLPGVTGDLVVRGAALMERLTAAADGKVLTAQGVETVPIYKSLFDLLTTKGDLWVRGTSDPERLASPLLGRILQGGGVGNLPYWRGMFNYLTTIGDIWIWNGADIQALTAGAAGTYLQGKGAGVLPAYEKTMPPLTTKGDLIVQDTTNPARLAAGAWGQVLMAQGAGEPLKYSSLINVFTTVGDLIAKTNGRPGRLAAGALDTYFKGQGAGVLPIYEKLALRDTGVHIGNDTRNAAGDQVITGVGFQPSVVIFIAADTPSPQLNWSTGFDNATTHPCLYVFGAATAADISFTHSITIRRDASNELKGLISAVGGDGFTITWTLVGTCNAEYVYLALP